MLYLVVSKIVYPFSIGDRELLARTCDIANLRDQLSILAELHSKQLLDGDTKTILAGLQKEHLSDLLIEREGGIFKPDLYPYQKDGVKWLVHCYFNKV